MGSAAEGAVVTRSISGHALVHHLGEQPRRGDPQRGTQSLGPGLPALDRLRAQQPSEGGQLLVGQRRRSTERSSAN